MSQVTISNDTFDCNKACRPSDESSWSYGLLIDPDARHVSHYYHYGSGIPCTVHDGRETIIKLPHYAVGEYIQDILHTPECQSLLAELCDAYKGTAINAHNNLYGAWDMGKKWDAEIALEQLFVDVPRFWAASDWMDTVWGQAEADHVRKLAAADPDGLAGVARDYVLSADSHKEHIDATDLERVLERLIDEYPETAQEQDT